MHAARILFNLIQVKDEPEGFENLPTPERRAEVRGATSQDDEAPGDEKDKNGQESNDPEKDDKNADEPSDGGPESDADDESEPPATAPQAETPAESPGGLKDKAGAVRAKKMTDSEARALAAEAANKELHAKMIALENQVFRMEKAAGDAAMQEERERERGLKRIEAPRSRRRPRTRASRTNRPGTRRKIPSCRRSSHRTEAETWRACGSRRRETTPRSISKYPDKDHRAWTHRTSVG